MPSSLVFLLQELITSLSAHLFSLICMNHANSIEKKVHFMWNSRVASPRHNLELLLTDITFDAPIECR